MLGAFTPHSLPKSLLFLIELTAGTRIWNHQLYPSGGSSPTPPPKMADFSTLTSLLSPTRNPAANTIAPPSRYIQAPNPRLPLTRSAAPLWPGLYTWAQEVLSEATSEDPVPFKILLWPQTQLSRALCFSPAILTSTTCPPSSFVTAPVLLDVPVKGRTSGLLHSLFLPAEKLFSHISAWHLPSHPSVFVQISPM